MIIKRLITIIILLFSNTLISQNNDNSVREIYLEKYDKTITITYQDYVRYVYGKDRDMIANFASSRNQFLVKITPGNSSSLSEFRKYVVTYLDAITQKQFVGYYDGNQHNWGSFERFVKDETRIAINDIEDEKRRVIAQKKFEKEEKERKRLAKIEERKRKSKEKRERIIEHLNRKPYQRYLLFGEHVGSFGRDKELISNYMEFDFIESEKFMSYGFTQSDEIEEVGELQIKWKDSSKGVFSSLKIGVKHMLDDKRISYYVNGVKTDFDLQLGNLSFYGRTKNEIQKEKLLKYGFLLFDKKVNHPYLYVSPISTVEDLLEFLSNLKSGYLFTKEEEKSVYKNSRYIGDYNKLINGFISKKIDYYIDDVKWFLLSCSVSKVKDKNKSLEFTITTYDNQRILNSTTYKFDKKKVIVESKSDGRVYEDYQVYRMLDGNYEYSDVMNN